ncbi:HAD-superfamily hydrolase-like protein [Halalkalibacter wakoensis JCM 9140]|uniref:Nucleotidase n=1 Tax=Halalkalibacter wakoensis JCM 9140 TaxID=1236970 RepID=W4PZ28_9BACI|nr:nucleotidase [Halalkalibacter wakoensis]GAE24743.1 HAD-superfamily hydrolase-like protein [Halalkalibacter wakoensis JCM 9140]
MRKRFGLDIDGTVTDPNTFVPYLNKHFNKSLTLDDLTEYDLTSILNISEEQFWEWMGQHEGLIYEQAELAEHAEPILHEWTKHHQLIYITARRNHLSDVTQKWFMSKAVPYDHIELVGKHDKLEAVREHQLDIFFEDKHDNAVAIAEEFNIPVILMDTPYNRLPSPTNVVRAQNWLEAKEWVDKWIKETT